MFRLANNVNLWGRRIFIVCLGCLVLSAGSCDDKEKLSPEVAANDQLCDEMAKSLRSDIKVGADLFIVSALVDVDRMNAKSEQQVVALRAMVLECRFWARGRRSADQLSDGIRRYAGVFTSEQDQEATELRLAALEKTAGQIRDGNGRSAADGIVAERDKILEEARKLNGDPASMKTSNDEEAKKLLNDLPLSVREDAKAELQKELSEAKIEAERIGVQTRLVRVERALEGLYYYQVFYEPLSFELSDNSTRYIESILSKLHAARRIRVVGYADDKGNDPGNIALSHTRAIILAQFLGSKGVTVEEAIGVGRSVDFGADQSSNRRVVIEVTR